MQYRTMRRLNPKKQAKKNRYYYWDIESFGLNPRNAPLIIVRPEKQYARHMQEEYIFNSPQEMRDWVDNLPKTKKHIFYAHNSSKFDTLALYTADEIADSPKVMAGSVIYTLRPKKHLEFRDSWHILSARLKAYGAKGITPQKFIDENHEDFGNWDSITEEDIEYCRQDVKILKEAIVTMREAYRDWVGHDSADLPLTSASLAFRVWCAKSWPEDWSYVSKKTGKTYYSVTFPDESNEAGKKAYYGGRVEVFPGFDGQVLRNVMSGDRNSMFPAEMRSQVFPDPNKVFVANPTKGRLYRARHSGMPYWGHVVLRATRYSELFLPSYVDGKLNYRQKKYDGYLMYPEINYALDNGWELEEVKELHVAKPCNHFKNHVEHFYKLRKMLQLDDDPRQLFIKIGPLNSLYGKFGQRDRCERVEDTKTMNRICSKPNWRDEYDVHFWTADENSKSYLVAKNPSTPSTNTFFPWAAAVTSYARVSLQSSISKCERAGFEVVYCDTDSIHIHNIENLDDIPLDIGKDLGQWGWEYPTDKNGDKLCDIVPQAKYWERKAYVWMLDNGKKIKIKHKGVSDSDGDLTKEQVNRSVINYRTALRRGLESGYEMKTVKRSRKWYNG